MSATDDGEDEAVPGREIAYRLFAAEYDDASLSYAESDEERAPNYVISPTGARLNRLFVVGTLTEVTSVNDEMVRARVVDPTGAFVVYAGQYQPDELATLEGLEPPAFVAVTGKARTFQPEDAEQVYTSIRPESIATVDADTRDRWVVSAAEQTLERVGTYAEAATSDASGEELTDALCEAGVESGLAAGVALAQDHYGTTPAYLEALRDVAIEAVEVVADERDQVSGLSLAPDASAPDSDATFDSLAAVTDVDLAGPESSVSDEPDTQPAQAAVSGAGEREREAAVDTGTETESLETDSATGTATGTDRESATAADTEVAEATLETAPSAESTSEDAGSTVETQSDPEPDEPTATFDESSESSDVSEAEPSDSVDEEPDDLGDFDDTGMYEMDDEEREQLEAEFGAEFTTGTEVEEPGGADIDVPEPDETPAADDFETESEAAADAAATDDPAGADDTGTVDAVDDDLGAPPESGLEADTEFEPTDAEPEATPDLEAEPSNVEDEEAGVDESTEAPEPESDEAADSEDDEGDELAADVDLQSCVIETMEALDDGSGADRTELVETVAADTGADESAIEDAIEDALMGGQCYEPDDETLKAI
ncbi:hypothetical protein RBH26_16650 [Natronolimnohabitans sp. A-GB9]|uniref:hypothetical protein n=1 Tax=Natronolimnohabitans sp. A-GB9 TaxID=3069757 RepID=UPI0027B524CF|nr:hypothetical protein [Natronolimnohabitans sp. A-GB9]MDQ2052109.1 hypothetical protein [Natronolimnohabitans sp. A-GB9]